MAATYLAQAYGDAFLELDIPFVRQLDRSKWYTLARMAVRSINCPPTSSLGRLFDAVAALLGLRSEVLYEGQAAIELEQLAGSHRGADSYPCALIGDAINRVPTETGIPAREATLNVAPMIRAIVSDIQRDVPLLQIASRFHRSIAELLAMACLAVREQTALNIVALSGGVFQNRLLLEQLVARLEGMAFQVYVNRRVPPNDGGLSLGQLAVAAARLQSNLAPATDAR
jgi:hydrogenase maturation protein HypF